MISVITPSYNQGRFIERCIRSVLAQGCSSFEHIVFDNDSSDETRDVLRRYPHVDWTSEPDRGQSHAVNKALRRARGEIIAWINADDAYEPGAFDVALRALRRETGVMAIAGAVRLTRPDGQEIETFRPRYDGLERLIEYWRGPYGLCQPGVLFRREVYERVGPLREDLHYAMDYDYWLRIAKHDHFKLVPETLATYVVHDQSKTGGAGALLRFLGEWEQVSRAHWRALAPARRRLAARACRRHAAEQFANAFVAGVKRGEPAPFDWLLAALRRDPRRLLDSTLVKAGLERLVGPRGWRWARRLAKPRRQAERQGAPSLSPVEETGETPVPPMAVEISSARLGISAPTRRETAVAVIIPTWNRAALLREAIASVRAQTVADACSIVVVDDGSTDETAQVVASLGGALQYIRQDNQGAAAARNAGIRASRSAFVAFLDSDDLWAPDKIERQLAALERYPAAYWVAGRAAALDPSGARGERPPPPILFDEPADFAAALLERNFLPTPTMLVRRAALAEAGLFRTDLRVAEDYDLWFRLACRFPGVVLDRVVASYRVGSAGSLSAAVGELLRSELRVRRLQRAAVTSRPDLAPTWRLGYAAALGRLRDFHYRRGDSGAAAGFALRAVCVSPTTRARWEWGRLLGAACGAARIAAR